MDTNTKGVAVNYKMNRHDPGKRGTYGMGMTRHHKQPLIGFSIARSHGLVLGDEVGMMPDGCKVYEVKEAGTGLPLNTSVVGMHSATYGCKTAVPENMIDPEPTWR
jgi:hypothetical protein